MVIKEIKEKLAPIGRLVIGSHRKVRRELQKALLDHGIHQPTRLDLISFSKEELEKAKNRLDELKGMGILLGELEKDFYNVMGILLNDGRYEKIKKYGQLVKSGVVEHRGRLSDVEEVYNIMRNYGDEELVKYNELVKKTLGQNLIEARKKYGSIEKALTEAVIKKFSGLKDILLDKDVKDLLPDEIPVDGAVIKKDDVEGSLRKHILKLRTIGASDTVIRKSVESTIDLLKKYTKMARIVKFLRENKIDKIKHEGKEIDISSGTLVDILRRAGYDPEDYNSIAEALNQENGLLATLQSYVHAHRTVEESPIKGERYEIPGYGPLTVDVHTVAKLIKEHGAHVDREKLRDIRNKIILEDKSVALKGTEIGELLAHELWNKVRSMPASAGLGDDVLYMKAFEETLLNHVANLNRDIMAEKLAEILYNHADKVADPDLKQSIMNIIKQHGPNAPQEIKKYLLDKYKLSSELLDVAHRVATQLEREGVNVKDVKDIVERATRDMSSIYLYIHNNAHKPLIDKLHEEFENKKHIIKAAQSDEERINILREIFSNVLGHGIQNGIVLRK